MTTGAGQSQRARLDQTALRTALLSPGSLWTALEVAGETGSTNADLLAAARGGAAEGTVLVAERQTSGRGRQGRSWITPPGAALTFSVLLRPAVPPAERGWLPLLTGVALARAVQAATGIEVTLKWPNDLLARGAMTGGGQAGGGKLAGILAEQAGGAIVVGLGINVSAGRDDLPAPAPGALPPTSLALQGATGLDRNVLLAAILRELEYWYRRWIIAATATGDSPGSDRAVDDGPGDDGAAYDGAGRDGAARRSGLVAEYRTWCSTIGRRVRVELPGGAELPGVATGIDEFGRLLVAGEAGVVPVSAGDIIHVR